MGEAIGKIDWAKWLPFTLTLVVVIVTNVATVTWFAATTSKDVETLKTNVSDIRNSDVASVKREFQALRSKVEVNEGSRISMDGRLIRIEEQVRYTAQTIEEVKRLLERSVDRQGLLLEPGGR